MLKSRLKKIYDILIKKRLADSILSLPTQREQQLINEIRTTFYTIPINNSDTLSKAALAWEINIKQLKTLILNEDPRTFLRWDIIKRTMFVGYPNYIQNEFNYLKALKTYENRWQLAIQETNIGCPERYELLDKSSGNLIHHAYHLAKFEEKTQLTVTDFDLIFEFGGGYGSICRLLHNLGFNQKYILFDLEPFTALQKYYIKSLGLKLLKSNNFLNAKSGILCLSSSKDLVKLMEDCNRMKLKSLFIATWSISETSIKTRNTILPIIRNFSAFLIAYQHQFEEVNNIDFFRYFREQNEDIEWFDWEIPHLTNNSYLMGQS